MTTGSRIVASALVLRISHPHAPALDVLDLVMGGVDAHGLDFGGHSVPPAAFALLVAEAFDSAMTPADWRGLTGPEADPTVRAALLGLWAAEVWPRFVARYPL